MPKLADRVKETTSTTGTGTLTLAGAVSGYRAFTTAFADADVVYYFIVGGTEWEVGYGAFTATGTTLARTTVLASSNAGALVNFSAGVKEVFCTLPAALADTFSAASKATPVNADLFGLLDSAAGFVKKKLTWANLKAAVLGVTAGTAVQVDQAVTATTRSATTTLGTTLNHTLSDTSTTITAFNGVAGVTYHCRALGAGAITHHATDLIITQTGASIAATAAGDTFDVYMITDTTSRVLNYTKADGRAITEPVSSVLQVAYADLATSSTTTATIPLDDTIPQITEGVEVLTCSITPQSATSDMLVVANWNLCENSNTTDGGVLAALFRDSTADAICAQAFSAKGSAGVYAALDNASCVMQKRVASGSTAATTFRLRLGGEVAGTYRWNGADSGRRLGGAMTISITIYELL